MLKTGCIYVISHWPTGESLCKDLIDIYVQASKLVVPETKLDYYSSIWQESKLSQLSSRLHITNTDLLRASFYQMETNCEQVDFVSGSLAKPQWKLLPWVEHILSAIATESLEVVIEYKHISSVMSAEVVNPSAQSGQETALCFRCAREPDEIYEPVGLGL